MDQELLANLRASIDLEAQVNALLSDSRTPPQERGKRMSELLAQAAADRTPLVDAWKAAGRPEPLGYRYSQHADKTEWFDGWREVETLVLEVQAAEGFTRDAIEALILNGDEPFDDVLECEELGAIFRSNEEPPEE